VVGGGAGAAGPADLADAEDAGAAAHREGQRDGGEHDPADDERVGPA
jgi:hypothetical protein